VAFMNCFGCNKKLDPILTFARPHGRYSRCEECRARVRRAHHAHLKDRAEEYLAAGEEPGSYLRRFLKHVCSRSC